jgi:hypothetical protein
MKKYLFGILAVALAIGFSAFTKPAKVVNKTTGDQYLFSYSLTAGSGEEAVETLANWGNGTLYQSQSLCADVNDRACKIIVDEEFTEVIGGQHKLILTLIAAESGDHSGVYHVDPSSNPDIFRISNKAF